MTAVTLVAASVTPAISLIRWAGDIVEEGPRIMPV
jgi:hypothetical protein